MAQAVFTSRLLSWYSKHARPLPWRHLQGNSNDRAYAVWISEIMLQQTRVGTVLGYYERWMARFPTLAEVAASDVSDVLKVWEGLGYYSRARNLHRTAQMIMTEYHTEFPHTKKELMRLPGIGPYTAAAIASIVFGQAEYVLDGNVRRVLARVFDVEDPLHSSAGERRFAALASRHLPSQAAGNYNQAIMELGALVCRPHQPECRVCPVNHICQARSQGLQMLRPVTQPKEPIPHYVVAAGVIWRDGKVLIAQRPAEGLLGGLWEFPGGKQQPGEELAQALSRELAEELAIRAVIGGRLGTFRHAYTHFRVTLHAFECELVQNSQPQMLEHCALAWVSPPRLADYPMGKIDRLISNTLIESRID
jgi:A/G-specific adenine glycosylase